MNSQDNAFFEEYKRLESLLNDAFSVKNGVSAYISEMEERAAKGRARHKDWDADYKSLKHVRWVRNRIAHENETERVSEPSDLRFVKDFRSRVLSGDDPLASKAKRSSPAKKTSTAKKSQKREEGSKAPVIIAIAVALGLIAVYFFLTR